MMHIDARGERRHLNEHGKVEPARVRLDFIDGRLTQRMWLDAAEADLLLGLLRTAIEEIENETAPFP